MNLSETAFVHPVGEEIPRKNFSLRWLTPSVEVPLCGKLKYIQVILYKIVLRRSCNTRNGFRFVSWNNSVEKHRSIRIDISYSKWKIIRQKDRRRSCNGFSTRCDFYWKDCFLIIAGNPIMVNLNDETIEYTLSTSITPNCTAHCVHILVSQGKI